MSTPLRQLILYLRLIWNYVVFWTIPTLQETYYTKLGHIYFNLEKYKKAISYFKKSEKSHNSERTFSKFNWYYLGISYLNLGNFKTAITYFDKYLTLEHRNYFVMYMVGICHSALNELEAAIQSFEKALDNGADYIEFWIEFSKVLKETGQKEKALELLQKAYAKCADVHQKAIIKSMRCWIGGNLEEAINTIKQVIGEIPQKSDYSNMKAGIYIMLSTFQKEVKDMSASLATLETAAALYPNDPIIMNELALDYAELEMKLDKAHDLITTALKYQPDNSLFLDTKGWILHKMGKSSEAEKVLQKSLQLNPKCKETLEHLSSLQADKR